MISKADLTKWNEWAMQDDWHRLFVGSDIRQMLGEIDRLKRQIKDMEADHREERRSGGNYWGDMIADDSRN